MQETLKRVPLGPFREAYERLAKTEGLTADGLALRLGWTRPAREGYDGVRGDGTRVRRTLGLKHSYCSKTKKHYYRRYVSYDTGVRLQQALGVDPYEVGV